ncbi:hypothetical protein HJC23_002759 [Cyclotella cryptica]|uniref:Uncharacterized protein n=1 Tax=Cyclotella cryptica TaxID=29204 RepID=A0ABD3PQC9_9STRA
MDAPEDDVRMPPAQHHRSKPPPPPHRSQSKRPSRHGSYNIDDAHIDATTPNEPGHTHHHHAAADPANHQGPNAASTNHRAHGNAQADIAGQGPNIPESPMAAAGSLRELLESLRFDSGEREHEDGRVFHDDDEPNHPSSNNNGGNNSNSNMNPNGNVRPEGGSDAEGPDTTEDEEDALSSSSSSSIKSYLDAGYSNEEDYLLISTVVLGGRPRRGPRWPRRWRIPSTWDLWRTICFMRRWPCAF